MATDRAATTRDLYRAFGEGDRAAVERHLADDFTFSAPPDPLLDRDGWFARCWPAAGTIRDFDIVRLIEHGDEIVVTYEASADDGRRFRNTEVATFAGDRIVRQEVYFGWDL